MKIHEGKVFQPQNATELRSITSGRQCFIEPYGLKQHWISITSMELKNLFTKTDAGLLFVREHRKIFCFVSQEAINRWRTEREAEKETA